VDQAFKNEVQACNRLSIKLCINMLNTVSESNYVKVCPT
jgi:hypothetical protein